MSGFYRERGKRLLDLAIAVTALLLLWPLIAAVACLVRLGLGRPVLFRQRRPGLHGELFTILKFRTMTDVRGPDGSLLPDGERLTALGRFLRATSLDELPEIINVIRGDMSVVGPRPLLIAYLTRYTSSQMRRHEVCPGITGLAQVNGRNALTWEEKFALDVAYVDGASFWLDVQILARTFGRVLRRDGISQPGQATAEEFMGVAGGFHRLSDSKG